MIRRPHRLPPPPPAAPTACCPHRLLPPPPAADVETPARINPETAPTTSSKPDERNAEVDFRGQKRSNATHASVTDPEARLTKKSAGTGATLCFMGEEDQKTVQWTVFPTQG